MANVENGELSSSRTETEKNLTEEMTGELTETFKGDSAVASSFGDDRFCLVEGDPDGSSCQENGLMDEKISPVVERQLQHLLNKADEIQAELVWSSDFLNDGLAGLIPMLLQTSQPYFTYLESTARNSHLQRPPLSIRTQLLQFSQKLCSRLEQLVLMYASFDILSIKETDPARYKRFINHRRFSRRVLILPKPKSKIDNMKLSVFRYCCPTPFLASANTRLHKRMRWNVDREEAEIHSSTEFYFLCCEDVLEEADANGDEKTATEKESLMMRIWSIGQWIQMYPDPDTDDITDWVLCSVPCGQYKQLLCLGNEEPSSCTATDCLLEVLLSEEINGTCVTQT